MSILGVSILDPIFNPLLDYGINDIAIVYICHLILSKVRLKVMKLWPKSTKNHEKWQILTFLTHFHVKSIIFIPYFDRVISWSCNMASRLSIYLTRYLSEPVRFIPKIINFRVKIVIFLTPILEGHVRVLVIWHLYCLDLSSDTTQIPIRFRLKYVIKWLLFTPYFDRVISWSCNIASSMSAYVIRHLSDTHRFRVKIWPKMTYFWPLFGGVRRGYLPWDIYIVYIFCQVPLRYLSDLGWF